MKEKRIPCPHCGELILPDAKKCRFCKERLDSKSPSFQVLYIVWLLSMVVFFVSLFFIRRADISAGAWTVVLSLAGLNILCGITAYLILVAKILSSIKTSRARWYGLAVLATFFAFFGLLFNYAAVEAKLGLEPLQIQQPAPAAIESPRPLSSPVPTTNKSTQPKTKALQGSTSNKITCTGPDGKTFQTTQEECDSFNKAWGNAPPPDPNEIVQCNIHPNCGGGYKEMTRSSCEQTICCSLNQGNILTSQEDCKNKQYSQCIETATGQSLSLYDAMQVCKK